MSFLTLYDPFHIHITPSYSRRDLARRQQQAYSAWQALAQQQASLFGAFDDLFNNFEPSVRTPSVNLKEEGKEYVIEAELPGVKKEDLEVTIGEGGKTVTIEGKVFRRETTGAPEPAEKPAAQPEAAAPAAEKPVAEQAVAEKPAGEVQPAAEPTSETTFSSMYSRTFALPKAVDGGRVSAKLVDGMLTLRLPQLEDTASRRITVA